MSERTDQPENPFAVTAGQRTALTNLAGHAISACPGCTNYVQQVHLTSDMLHQLAQEPAFPGTKQELLRFFRNWKKG